MATKNHEVIMPDGEIRNVDWSWMDRVVWRDRSIELPPSVPCDDPTVSCGIPNPFAPEAVAQRLDELFDSTQWQALQARGRQGSAPGQALEQVRRVEPDRCYPPLVEPGRRNHAGPESGLAAG